MKLDHPELVRGLRKAYSAEKAAALAYIGHANSLKDATAIAEIREIENDEWEHRYNVREIMEHYDIPVSRFSEWSYNIIGKAIGFSCHLIGRFMPYFFAGKLESGNVCAYFVMKRQFNELGIHEHDEVLHEMGIKEKEHEIYFLETIKDCRWLPLFEKIFSWGTAHTENDVDLEDQYTVEESNRYCKR